MSQVIIYPNTETGGVVILHPILSCGLTLEQIAAKDVPTGLPYLVVNKEDLPSANEYMEAWEADFSNPHGNGADFGVGSFNAVVGWTIDGNPIVRVEKVIQ